MQDSLVQLVQQLAQFVPQLRTHCVALGEAGAFGSIFVRSLDAIAPLLEEGSETERAGLQLLVRHLALIQHAASFGHLAIYVHGEPDLAQLARELEETAQFMLESLGRYEPGLLLSTGGGN